MEDQVTRKAMGQAVLATPRLLTQSSAPAVKACTMCGQVKSLGEYHGPKNGRCKPCFRVAMRIGRARGKANWVALARTRSADLFARAIPRPSGCWEFEGGLQSEGYGYWTVGGRSVLAHRAMWAIHHGDPGALDICHSCDNRRCLNPDHLFIGTREDNMRDASSKGRTCRGERRQNSKLTEATVREIRQLARVGGSRRLMAERFGVCHRQITAVILRKAWAWVEDTP